MAEPPPQQLERGQRVDRYIVVGTLGAGGMGVVHAAYDPDLDRKVALKIVRPRAGSAQVERELQLRLLREAQAMARLAHPNTVPVHDVGSFEGSVFIAMELVEGCTLKEWLKQHPRSWREVVRAFTEAGRGLAAAHSAGLVHRDFKPDNVLVGRDGRFRVTDFGLARTSGETPESGPAGERTVPDRPGNLLDSPLTSGDQVVGTAAYMAPEQHRNLAVDARSDQFSFCVALHEALYRQKPFQGDPVTRMAKRLTGRVDPPGDRARVPAWLRRVVVRGLRPDPAERFPSMDALLAALADDPAIRRRRWLLPAGAAAAIALALAGWTRVGALRVRSCRESLQDLQGVWDDPARERVRAAFLATAKPFAADTWERVRARLDAYAARWAGARTEVCAAARAPAEPGEQLQALRLACLDRQRSELRSLISVFSRADAGVLERALVAAGSLPPPSSCEAGGLRFERALPSAPEERERILGLRGELAEAHSFLSAGRYREGVALAEKVAAEAKSIRSPPLETEARLLLCRLHRKRSAWPEMERACEAAAWAAEVARDDELKTRAVSQLLFVTAYRLGRHREAETWARWAHALLEKLGAPPELEAEVLDSHSALLDVTGRREEDLRMTLRALELRRQVFGDDHAETAKSYNNLGLCYSNLGRFELAAENARRAAEIQERVLGPNHPNLILPLSNLAEYLAAVGRFAEAMQAAERARALAVQQDPDGYDAAITQGVLLSVLTQSGRHREAIEEGRRLEELLRRRNVGEGSSELSTLSLNLGYSQVRTGQAREGLALCEKAMELLKRQNRGPTLVGFQCIGEALLALGKPGAARQVLETGIGFPYAERSAAGRMGHLKFALARALVAGQRDRPRARALAEAARDEWRAVPSEQGALAEVEAWLAKLGP